MLELFRGDSDVSMLSDSARRPGERLRDAAPDRRRYDHCSPEWLGAALDEVDYGVVLLAPDGEVLHINEVATAELDAGHPLRRVGRHLQASSVPDAARLQDALRNAFQRCLRKLVWLGEGGDRVAVSIVPLPGHPATRVREENRASPTLLLFGKRRVCETLSVQAFAQCHGLTGAESRVLTALCHGKPPGRIADELGVAISTVRTHLGTIRLKTGTGSLRDLVSEVSQLPPLRGVLRRGSCGPDDRQVSDRCRLAQPAGSR